MQNSLERLFEGMAAALHRDVLPELDDDFARTQLIATIELLGNLATRVTWLDDHRAERMADLAERAATGDEDPDLRAEILSALDAELTRLRSARFGRPE